MTPPEPRPTQLRPLPIDPRAPPLRVVLDAEPAPLDETTEARVRRRWDEITRRNPHAFDGTILAFLGYDARSNTITARRERYRRLAVRPEIETGVVLLGVTGFCSARDRNGHRRVLLARRSTRTRVYGGLWECAPSGGLDAPAGRGNRLELGDVIEAFRRESDEELGLRHETAQPRAVALLRDPIASSLEIVVEARAETDHAGGPTLDDLGTRPITRNWEYDDARWFTDAEIAELVRRSPDVLTPPTRALLSGRPRPG